MTAGFDEERIGPFIVRRQPDVAIVVCPEYLDDTRAEKDEKSLLGVVDANKLVICDVSDTKEMTVNWLRFLARMSERSSAAGKRFVLCGSQESVINSASHLGIENRLSFLSGVNEVIEFDDPLADWFRENPTAEVETRGKFVGFVAGEGVIASAPTRRELRELITSLGRDPLQVLIVGRADHGAGS